MAALWKPPLLAGMWPAPAWLQEAQALGSKPVAAAAGNAEGSSSSSEEASSSSEEGSSSEEESSSSGSGSSDSEGHQPQQQQAQQAQQAAQKAQQAQGSSGKGGMFDALDKLFMSGGGSRRLVLDQLGTATTGAGAISGTAAGAAGGGAAASRARPAAGATARKAAAVSATAAAAARSAAAAVAAPARRRQPVAAPADAGEADDVAVIGGKRFQLLPAQAGINVWVCQKLASKAGAAGVASNDSASQQLPAPVPPRQQQQQQAGGRQHGQQQGQEQMLGFVCHLRGTDQLLLLTNLHSRAAAAQLLQHPALALLAQQPGRVAAVLHMAAPGVAGSRALRQLCQQLRPAVQGPAAGQQLLLEQPGAHGSGQVRAVAC